MADHAASVAPHMYRVVLENDRVRVVEVRAQPGAKAEMHSHPPLVAIPLSANKVRFTLPDGQSAEVELPAGEAMYMDAQEHATENIGTTEMHALLVELK